MSDRCVCGFSPPGDANPDCERCGLVSELAAARAEVDRMEVAESMDIRRRKDGTWIASFRDDPRTWTVGPTLRGVITAIIETRAAKGAER